jgi:hypothetical protein
VNQQKDEPGLRFDAGKPRVDLIPADAILEIGNVFGWGAKKYAEHNWCKGMSWSRVLGSAERHLLAIKSGEDRDEESNLTHAGHLAWNAIVLISYLVRGVGKDDRFKENANVQQPGNPDLYADAAAVIFRNSLRQEIHFGGDKLDLEKFRPAEGEKAGLIESRREVGKSEALRAPYSKGHGEGEEGNFAQGESRVDRWKTPAPEIKENRFGKLLREAEERRAAEGIRKEPLRVGRFDGSLDRSLGNIGDSCAERARLNGVYLARIDGDKLWHFVEYSGGVVARPSLAIVRDTFNSISTDHGRANFLASDGNLSEWGCNYIAAFGFDPKEHRG